MGDILTNEFKRTPISQLYTLIPYLKEKKRIAPNIDMDKALALANYYECLSDTLHKMPAGKYTLFELIEDKGVQKLQIGTKGNGFHSHYRMFSIEAGNTANFAAIGLNKYSKDRTILCVVLQKKNKFPHHSLQLAIDDYMFIKNNECIFKHKGNIGLGSIGSGLRSVLRERYAVKLYPQIIHGDEYLLGKLNNNRIWHFDDKEMINFTENLISYAIIRDMYRDDAHEVAAK